MASEGLIRGKQGATWGELGGYWGGAPHGSYAFSSAESPNTTLPDRVYSCKTTTWPKAPCENGNAGGLVGRYCFAQLSPWRSQCGSVRRRGAVRQRQR